MSSSLPVAVAVVVATVVEVAQAAIVLLISLALRQELITQ
jgi:hypothetical protein